MRNPKTRAEWQEVVDAAAGARAIADCEMYGLIAGGPKINVARCDHILARGAKRGVRPSRPVVELAAEMIAEWNGSVEERHQ